MFELLGELAVRFVPSQLDMLFNKLQRHQDCSVQDTKRLLTLLQHLADSDSEVSGSPHPTAMQALHCCRCWRSILYNPQSYWTRKQQAAMAGPAGVARHLKSAYVIVWLFISSMVSLLCPQPRVYPVDCAMSSSLWKKRSSRWCGTSPFQLQQTGSCRR